VAGEVEALVHRVLELERRVADLLDPRGGEGVRAVVELFLLFLYNECNHVLALIQKTYDTRKSPYLLKCQMMPAVANPVFSFVEGTMIQQIDFILSYGTSVVNSNSF
jgi:hypothetical protein